MAWINDPSHLKIVEKSRQVGLSYADSYDSVRKAARKHGRDVWVMSRDEKQAQQYILYCKRWANVLKYAARDLGEKMFTMENGKPVKMHVLNFASGASIYALSSNPDAIVGKTGHVKLDEFALHKDQRTLFAVAKPVIQWGGTLSIISTHRGIGTVFNELVTDARRHGNKMGWSLHTIPIQSAVAAGLVEKIDAANAGQWTERWQASLSSSPSSSSSSSNRGGDSLSPQTQPDRGCVAEQPQQPALLDALSSGVPAAAGPADTAALRSQTESHTTDQSPVVSSPVVSGLVVPSLRDFWLSQQRAECIDEEQWLQEYCCTPADESVAFITYDMITACEDDDARKDFAYLSTLDPQRSTLFIGFDVARTRDLSVIDVEEKVGDVYWERLRVELHGKTFAEQEYELRRLLDLPAVQRCCIDATGIGMQLAENMIAHYGHYVEAVRFTGPVKEELAFPLRAAHEDRTLRYARDEQLRADLRGIRKETTASGNLRFAGESADSHCDRFWAKALALHAGKTAQFPGRIELFENTVQSRVIRDRLYGGILG